VAFADLDNFKAVNDRLGHAVGDAVLQAVANSLVAGLRTSDTVSRHGGDEFVILLSEIKDTSDAIQAVQKIVASIETTHRIGPHELQATASIGISVYPDHGLTGEVLLNEADAAMYRAKGERGTKYQFAA
jgi:diguanylate cyclase (GGDEF)-like protein